MSEYHEGLHKDVWTFRLYPTNPNTVAYVFLIAQNQLPLVQVTPALTEQTLWGKWRLYRYCYLEPVIK